MNYESLLSVLYTQALTLCYYCRDTTTLSENKITNYKLKLNLIFFFSIYFAIITTIFIIELKTTIL